MYNSDGEELTDDEDLEDEEAGAGLAGLMDDPGSIQETIEQLGGDDGTDVWEQDPRLKEHAEKRKRQRRGASGGRGHHKPARLVPRRQARALPQAYARD